MIFDSTEEDARVEEVDVVRDYDVTRSPFFAFDMKASAGRSSIRRASMCRG